MKLFRLKTADREAGRRDGRTEYVNPYHVVSLMGEAVYRGTGQKDEAGDAIVEFRYLRTCLAMSDGSVARDERSPERAAEDLADCMED